MAVRIVGAKIITDYSWGDLKNLNSWSAVKNTNTSWQSILQATATGHNIKIEVEVTEGTWGSVKELLPSWNKVQTEFNDWVSLKNW